MISAVAEMYNIHPQTLRLYEREGLLKPSRSEGNTRLYTEEDLDGWSDPESYPRPGRESAGVKIVLNMRPRMDEMEREMQAFMEMVRDEMLGRSAEAQERIQNALVRIAPPHLTRTSR